MYAFFVLYLFGNPYCRCMLFLCCIWPSPLFIYVVFFYALVLLPFCFWLCLQNCPHRVAACCPCPWASCYDLLSVSLVSRFVCILYHILGVSLVSWFSARFPFAPTYTLTHALISRYHLATVATKKEWSTGTKYNSTPSRKEGEGGKPKKKIAPFFLCFTEKIKKPAAPQGVPRRSPTPVLTGPCAA